MQLTLTNILIIVALFVAFGIALSVNYFSHKNTDEVKDILDSSKEFKNALFAHLIKLCTKNNNELLIDSINTAYDLSFYLKNVKNNLMDSYREFVVNYIKPFKVSPDIIYSAYDKLFYEFLEADNEVILTYSHYIMDNISEAQKIENDAIENMKQYGEEDPNEEPELHFKKITLSDNYSMDDSYDVSYKRLNEMGTIEDEK